MKNVYVSIPDEMYKSIENRVDLGIYSNVDEVVNKALKKMFAEQSREFLRKMTKNLGITKDDVLSELENVRDSK
ncbi:MAG: hypothetical protein A7316_04680 [Candidatus Altiarchaeales archaeon WOR_SM1_86-2]|nr:MAG: hypothetical protein A7316_04680 [Candidatus Altiarchaeales archaeon WOR_SM1_86-2]